MEPLGLPEHELYLADGFTEQLGAALTAYQDVHVFGPLRRTRLAADVRSAEEIAAQYGADFLLRGTLRKLDGIIKVSIRLVEQASGETAWSGQYDHRLEPTEWFDFEEYVASCIASTVAGSFGVVMRRLTQRLLERKTSSHISFEAMLRWHHYFTVLTTDAWYEARVALEDAIVADPNYALTHAMLADMCGAEYHVMGADQAVLTQADALRTARAPPGSQQCVCPFHAGIALYAQGSTRPLCPQSRLCAERRAPQLGFLGWTGCVSGVLG